MDREMRWWDKVRSRLISRKVGSSPTPVPDSTRVRYLKEIAHHQLPPRETCEASEDSPGLASPAERNETPHSIIEHLPSTPAYFSGEVMRRPPVQDDEDYLRSRIER